MIDEAEETDGFGSSFSRLFDVGPSETKPRLNREALSRLCMSDRLLTRFQQQEQDETKSCSKFQHVAAKFDGVSIHSGLGTLDVTSLEGGGVVWLQTMQSDSNAQEKERKDVTDDTNQSAAALFLSLAHITDVLPTVVQKRVKGVEIQLVDRHRLELIFMPGTADRDKFLELLKKQMSERVSDVVKAESTCERQKEELRCLVRRYTKLDEQSEEGLAIAKQVYACTGYYLGPTTKEIPKFAMDSKYRKKSLEKLTGFLNRLNQEWSDADSQRELHTKTKHSRNEDGLFEYTDTVSGVQISSRTYEQRYLHYVKAHKVNPVLHQSSGQETAARDDKVTENGASAPSAVLESDENAKSLFMATMGIDISSSSIIDKSFFTSGAKQAPLDIPRYRGEDMAFRAAVDSARANLWLSWGIAFDRVSAERAIQPKRGYSDKQLQPTIGVAGRSATRKRARERRRSLVLPDSDEIQSTIEASIANTSEDANDTTSSKGEYHQPRPKRCRSMSQTLDTARKSRRQSIVSQVDFSSIVTNEAEEKTAAMSCRATPSSRKSTS